MCQEASYIHTLTYKRGPNELKHGPDIVRIIVSRSVSQEHAASFKVLLKHGFPSFDHFLSLRVEQVFLPLIGGGLKHCIIIIYIYFYFAVVKIRHDIVLYILCH